MKKYLYIVSLLLLSVYAWSIDIVPTGGVKVSLLTYDENVLFDKAGEKLSWSYDPNTIVIDISIGAYLGEHFLIDGNIVNYIRPMEEISFLAPIQADYYINASVIFDSISFGVSHACYHPIKTPGHNDIHRYGGFNEMWAEWRF